MSGGNYGTGSVLAYTAGKFLDSFFAAIKIAAWYNKLDAIFFWPRSADCLSSDRHRGNRLHLLHHDWATAGRRRPGGRLVMLWPWAFRLHPQVFLGVVRFHGHGIHGYRDVGNHR
ncbi:hypothetical protein ACU4GD_14470 [Cupriavidus basilensis]